VHIGGVAMRSCQVPVSQVASKAVTTIRCHRPVFDPKAGALPTSYQPFW
jgi:aerobic-type carbon monoxide dehydrogenase small subunit (CoxS/CutS family)